MNGPPESEMPAPPQDRHSRNISDATQCNPVPDTRPGTSLVWIPCTRPPAAQDRRSQLARRRDAAARSVPLECGCRDPWPCLCTEPPLSDRTLDGYRDAALHVLASGHIPILPIDVRRALYRRGGSDRVLAERLHQACGGEVA